MPGRKPTGKPNGRPRTEINWKEFDKLCQLQCTKQELASFFGVEESTIERAVERDKGMGFALYFAKKAAGGKRSLRRKQFQAALAGNTALLIWLGKQYLGQSEKVETKQDITERKALATPEQLKEAFEKSENKY